MRLCDCPQNELDLHTGLKGHHPLGFMAACGLLRISGETARLGWKRQESGFWTARLSPPEGIEAESFKRSLSALVVCSASGFLRLLDACLIKEAEAPVPEFRRWANSQCPPTDLLPALGSDVLQKKKSSGSNKGRSVIVNTALAMTSGQQDLISGARRLAEKLVKKGKVAVIPPNVIASVEEALFGPWLYKDSEHPLGWDPNTQRIHALRNKAPTNDTAGRSVAAAVFLATQALPLFPCFARGGRLMTTGFYRDGDDQEWFEWPIWRAPLAIDALRSLVARPFTADLKLCGVDVVYHCPRIRSPGSSEGNYRVFGHASERLWPAGAAGEAVSLQQR